ncbi:uncharacterized protein LOC134231229 [Saccostrea cucullata]|uniref:uncharacterized protein LOC134231229 n=1 Tax=Saccostrea cuccullata TaxID=36930 RepID=UPI002ED3D3B6
MAIGVNVVENQLHVCSFNVRSIRNKTASLCDYIVSNNFDVVALTETWLGTSNDKICINELVPEGYTIKHVSRGSSKRGGGVALIYKRSITVKRVTSNHSFSQFELLDCTLEINGLILQLATVYRPPPSKENGLKTNVFLEEEWPRFLSEYTVTDKEIIIVGDLNVHFDVPTDRDTITFNSILESNGMKQLVNEPTHIRGHTLDVIITRDTSNILSSILVTDPGLCGHAENMKKDHFAVTFTANVTKPLLVRKAVTYRKLKSIDVDLFKQDIDNIDWDNASSSNVDRMAQVYTDELTKLVDKHAPVQSKTITLRPQSPWFGDDLHSAKHLKRKLERKWRDTKLINDHQIYRNQCIVYNIMLHEARTKYMYYANKVEESGRDTKSLFKLTKHLLGGNSDNNVLSSGSTPKETAQNLSNFFTLKIENIRDGIRSDQTGDAKEHEIEPQTNSRLLNFLPALQEEVRKIIQSSPNKSCELDPIPTWLLK